MLYACFQAGAAPPREKISVVAHMNNTERVNFKVGRSVAPAPLLLLLALTD